ncbi:hypothetical protein BDV33DRAFT_43923 [Aspergillus novoparasiticus]|uniref:RGS domain-containing protein n=1 Tax=Aspergillus novoparasiticus TaxID=986946 RepID=A0A5N6F092_9EURO|nr:hypothetical protein BDV33DRAFT_43923 [Aspergillus novoparasiticus]
MGSELGITPETKPQAVYTPVSIWWACWAGVWTTALVLGMLYLIANRNMPTLRIRGIGMSLSAIVLLHLYWASVQFGVMIGPIMPGDAQYWIMGTYLGCGIALFHASNTRFLHVAKHQRQFAHHGSRITESVPDEKPKSGLFVRFRRLEYTKRILILVAIAMAFQIFLTILLWVISRKWHSSWGIPGTEVTGTPSEQAAKQGTGWEWWPTAFFQFFWAWIVAPIVLWKARHIHDTQGWRVQTIGCAIANLHATPMWLIALYVPAMEVVNQYWIPPQWICLSIWVMEIFTVFLPCWEVMRHHALRQETFNAIEQWESKMKKSGSDARSLNSIPTLVDSMMSGWKSHNGSVDTTGSRDSILTMGALEHVLERNPAPLQKFSALNDFSGENVAFLTSVAEWKNSLPKALRENTDPMDNNMKELLHERFNRALHIYVKFISVSQAEFPVNISSQDLRKLENIFEGPARALYGEKRAVVDPVTPFDTPSFPMKSLSSPSFGNGSQVELHPVSSDDRVQFWGEVPEAFGPTVFNDAEKSIKYLVLTNTWPKFVKSRRSPDSIRDEAV